MTFCAFFHIILVKEIVMVEVYMRISTKIWEDYIVLDVYKKLHEDSASIVDGWKTMNKNDLINAYIDVENDKKLADAYMSAIILRYWSNIYKYSALSYKSVNDPTIYYDWLVSSIMKAIKNRKWKDPSNKLYNDPNGPDKVVNRCLKSARLGWYQVNNKNNRKINFGLCSVDHLTEELGEAAPFPTYEDVDMSGGGIDVKNMMRKLLNNGEFVTAFLVNGVVNYDVFDKESDSNGKSVLTLNQKRLYRYIHNLTDNDCSLMSYYLNEPIDNIYKARDECRTLTRLRLRSAIKVGFAKLRKMYTEV